VRDELVQGKIENRHEAKETQQKNDLPDGIYQISDGVPGRDELISPRWVEVMLMRPRWQIASQRIAGGGLTALWIAHTGDQILDLLRRFLCHQRNNPYGDESDR
jgi:hypothetical protein